MKGTEDREKRSVRIKMRQRKNLKGPERKELENEWRTGQEGTTYIQRESLKKSKQ